MGQHHERTIVPFTPDQMFDLVADVEDYPRFIPWVEALRVRSRTQGDAGAEQLTADMVVGYKMFRESFRSNVALDRQAMTIGVDYVRGPLRSLTNHWKFLDDPLGCAIDFRIAFEFKNRLMQTVANQLIDKAFKRLSGAFVEEAHRRYRPISTARAAAE